eukprot:scaffold1284_cov353-Prasinococcus_capsulatus_cf.AAC.2
MSSAEQDARMLQKSWLLCYSIVRRQPPLFGGTSMAWPPSRWGRAKAGRSPVSRIAATGYVRNN